MTCGFKFNSMMLYAIGKFIGLIYLGKTLFKILQCTLKQVRSMRDNLWK